MGDGVAFQLSDNVQPVDWDEDVTGVELTFTVDRSVFEDVIFFLFLFFVFFFFFFFLSYLAHIIIFIFFLFRMIFQTGILLILELRWLIKTKKHNLVMKLS